MARNQPQHWSDAGQVWPDFAQTWADLGPPTPLRQASPCFGIAWARRMCDAWATGWRRGHGVSQCPIRRRDRGNRAQHVFRCRTLCDLLRAATGVRTRSKSWLWSPRCPRRAAAGALRAARRFCLYVYGAGCGDRCSPRHLAARRQMADVKSCHATVWPRLCDMRCGGYGHYDVYPHFAPRCLFLSSCVFSLCWMRCASAEGGFPFCILPLPVI